MKTLDQILEPVKLLLDEEDGGTSSYKIRFDESQLYPIPYFPGHKFEIDLRPYSNKFKWVSRYCKGDFILIFTQYDPVFIKESYRYQEFAS